MASKGNGLRVWWRHRRSLLIANPRFQRLAKRLPVSRQIGNRRARDLFDLTAGFVYSQVLFALVEAGILTALKDRPQSTGDIARACDIPAEKLDRLLHCAAELELIIAAGDVWVLRDLGAVVASNPGIEAMIRHHAMLYDDLKEPLALLRGEITTPRTRAFWSYAGAATKPDVSDRQASAYSDLMSHSQDLIIEEILAGYSLSRHSEVLDIGGGEGRFLRAVGTAHPNIRLRLFDLPAVAERLHDRQETESVKDPIEVTAGDFFRDALPGGADLITLIRILCDHDDDRALELLRRIRDTMQPGQTLLIAEPMAGRDGKAGRAAAYFGMYFLAMQSGRCRTPAEIQNLLKRAGFATSRRVKTRQPLMASIIVTDF